jgi:hypothetical protein
VVYGDPGSKARSCDDSLATTLLVAGEAVPAGMTELGRSMGGGFAIDPVSVAPAYGDTFAMVVVAVDRASNESVASNVACGTRIETMGFCDAYDCGDGCSVSGVPAPKHGVLGGVFFALAACALAHRRKTKKKRNHP